MLDSYQENKLTTYLEFLKDYDLEEAQILEGEGSMSGLVRQEAAVQ